MEQTILRHVQPLDEDEVVDEDDEVVDEDDEEVV